MVQQLAPTYQYIKLLGSPLPEELLSKMLLYDLVVKPICKVIKFFSNTYNFYN